MSPAAASPLQRCVHLVSRKMEFVKAFIHGLGLVVEFLNIFKHRNASGVMWLFAKINSLSTDKWDECPRRKVFQQPARKPWKNAHSWFLCAPRCKNHKLEVGNGRKEKKKSSCVVKNIVHKNLVCLSRIYEQFKAYFPTSQSSLAVAVQT